MLRRLKTRTTPRASIIQTPRLPFDVLFRIIDEEFAAAKTVQARNGVCRIFGGTCRELSIYCRAILFRSIHFNLYFNPGEKLPADVKRSTAVERFTQLMGSYPSTLKLIQQMDISIDCGWYPVARRLLDVITHKDISRGRESLGIMTTCYPTLKVLKVTGPQSPFLDRKIEDAALWMIQHAGSLEILVLDISLLTLPNMLQYCPLNLKHVKYIGERQVFETRLRGTIRSPPREERPMLEGFTYAVQGALKSSQLHSLLSDLACMLEQNRSLKHMELWSFHGLQGFTAFSPLIQQASQTLRCLHILCPNVGNGKEVLPSLDLGSLCVLQFLEVGFSPGGLGDGLKWITNSLATISPEHVSDSRDAIIITCVQQLIIGRLGLVRDRRERHRAHLSNTWTRVHEEYSVIWPDGPDQIRATIYTFAECVFHGGKRIEEPELLLPFLGDVGSHLQGPVPYSTLLKRYCTCYRVRETIADM